MEIKKLQDHVGHRPSPGSTVTVKEMGNITEVRYRTAATGGLIHKIDRDSYCDTRTGEVFDYNHGKLRVDNVENVSRTLRNLRDIINTNVTDCDACLWCTLTYAENMQDSKRLYENYRRFNQRFQRYLKSSGHPPAEYIATAEPQGRGAWHLHVLFIFPGKAPFIPNNELAKLWRQGFVKIKSLKDVDNVGVYLTAYLGDMDILQAFGSAPLGGKIKEVDVTDNDGKKGKKAIVKGARLRLYPASFHLYRSSRGIRKPAVSKCTEAQAMKLVANQPLTFERTIQLLENSTAINTINYRHFNRLAKQAGSATPTASTTKQSGGKKDG